MAPRLVSLQSIQCFAASLREGGYRSAQTYFPSIFSYQRPTLQIEVEGLVKQTAKDYARSIGRGLGPTSLKDAFEVDTLSSIPTDFFETSFDIMNPAHSRDVMILRCWFID